jgi:hypothetical protein
MRDNPIDMSLHVGHFGSNVRPPLTVFSSPSPIRFAIPCTIESGSLVLA